MPRPDPEAAPAPGDDATLAEHTTLGGLLRARGLAEPATRAVRHTLDRRDACDEFRSVADLVQRGLLGAYERMQDGRRLGHDNALLSFAAEPGARARLVGYRRVSRAGRGSSRATSSTTTTRRRSCTPSSPAHAVRSSTTRSTCPASTTWSAVSSCAGRLPSSPMCAGPTLRGSPSCAIERRRRTGPGATALRYRFLPRARRLSWAE